MKKILERTTEFLLTVIIIIMISAVCWQVFARYVLGNPSGITEELMRYSLVWLTMIGGAYAYGKGKHVSFVFALRKLSDKTKAGVQFFVDLCVIFFAVIIMIYGGFITSNNAVGQISAALRMPIQFLYGSLVVSGILITFYAIFNISERIKSLKTRGN